MEIQRDLFEACRSVVNPEVFSQGLFGRDLLEVVNDQNSARAPSSIRSVEDSSR